MSSSSGLAGRLTGGFGRTVVGAVLIVVQAAVIGLAANAINPHRLPWVRIPLRETHRMAASREVLPPSPPASLAVNPNDASRLPVPDKTVGPVPRAQPLPSAPEQTSTSTPPPIPKPRPSAQPNVKPLVKPKKVEALFTTLPDAKALFDKKAAVFVDARHREDYDVEHVPGAQSIFVEDVEKLYDSVLGAIPKDRTIVTYCSDPQCETAIKLADSLVARGHKRVFILLEGLPGWKDAGYPTTTGGTQ